MLYSVRFISADYFLVQFVVGEHYHGFVCLSLSRFKNIPQVDPTGSRFVFDWNPCTKFDEGDGCKAMLVSALKGL